MSPRITRFDDDLANLKYNGFEQNHPDGRTLSQTFPHVFYMGFMTHRAFTDQILWVRANCSGLVAHNYDIRVMRQSLPGRRRNWHTVIGFSDLRSATAFKLVWGHARSTLGYRD